MLYLITYNTWFIFKAHGIHGMFYKGTALACLFAYLAFHFPVKYLKLNEKLNSIAILLALSNLLDEIFFDPTAFQWNEYIAATLILIFIFRAEPNKKIH